MRFYYYKEHIFALVKFDTRYKVPLSESLDAAIGSEDERDYFFAENGGVCSWYLNGSEQNVDVDTVDMVKDYVAGVL